MVLLVPLLQQFQQVLVYLMPQVSHSVLDFQSDLLVLEALDFQNFLLAQEHRHSQYFLLFQDFLLHHSVQVHHCFLVAQDLLVVLQFRQDPMALSAHLPLYPLEIPADHYYP